jgi:predicted DNA-binding transcriptional regulator AlpA
MSSDPEMIDVREVAKLIGGSKTVTRTTVQRLVRAGKLPQPVRLSQRFVRWDKEKVLKCLRGEAA